MEFQWKWRCVSALAEQSALILGHSQIKNQEQQSQYVWWLIITHLLTEEVVLGAEVLTLHCDMLFFIRVTALLYSQALSPVTLWQWYTALWMEWPLHPLFSWHLVFSTLVIKALQSNPPPLLSLHFSLSPLLYVLLFLFLPPFVSPTFPLILQSTSLSLSLSLSLSQCHHLLCCILRGVSQDQRAYFQMSNQSEVKQS